MKKLKLKMFSKGKLLFSVMFVFLLTGCTELPDKEQKEEEKEEYVHFDVVFGLEFRDVE
jgi:starvation-inducible outer membrane lipoprotein